MLMMVNPKRKRRATARARKRTARKSAPRRRRKRRNNAKLTTTRTTTVSTKKANPRRRRRKRRSTGTRARARRRNPPTGKNIIRKLQTGLMNAGAAVLGKGVARVLPQQLGIPTAGAPGIAAQVAVGLGIGLIADRLPISSQLADSVLVGALMAPIESLVVTLNVPFLSPALASYPMASYPLAGGLIPPEIQSRSRLNALPGSADRPQEFAGYGYYDYYGAGFTY